MSQPNSNINININILKGLSTGGAAVMELALFGNILDLLKIEKQRSIHKSYPKIWKEFSHKSKWRALRMGIWPWGVGLYGCRGLVYGYSYSSVLDNIKQTPMSLFSQKIIASSVGGMIEGACTSPFYMMRTRVVEYTNRTQKPPFDIRGVLRGIPVNSTKRGIDWGLRGALYHTLYNHYNIDPMISGFLAGIISTTMTTPIDRLLPVVQQTKPPKKIVSWLYQLIKERGLKAVFAGGGARILHGGWHTLFIFGSLHLFQQHKLLKF